MKELSPTILFLLLNSTIVFLYVKNNNFNVEYKVSLAMFLFIAFIILHLEDLKPFTTYLSATCT